MRISNLFCIFARKYGKMGRRLFFIVLFSALVCSVQASIITLRNGQKITGEIIVQNDEVVIVKNTAGARFQYPANEVVSISEDETTEEKPVEQKDEEKPQGKRMTFLIGLSGGAAIIPQDHSGGHVGGELMIGSRYIGKKDIFLGGGISVHGMFVAGKTYTFLPLQLAVKVPFLEGKHTPIVGANIGYGFGVSKNCVGGIYSAAEVGYRYAYSARSALILSLRAQFQQAKIDVVETITENDISTDYVSRVGRSFVTFGAHLALTF